jgi:hypothetical protein
MPQRFRARERGASPNPDEIGAPSRAGGVRTIDARPSPAQAGGPVASGAHRLVLRDLPREVAEIIRARPAAAIAPAAVLGAGADALVLLRHDLGASLLVAAALALAFELYVGFAELLAADQHDGRRTPVGALLRHALPLTPALLVASLVAVTLPLAATGLLVLPGLWLLTRWSLFAPAVVHEGLRPVAAIRRSASLVEGAFWPVALSVTLSLLIEHAVIHGTAHAVEPALGSRALGLLGAALAALVVSPPAAFTISIVYERLAAAPPARRSGVLVEPLGHDDARGSVEQRQV